MSSRPRNQWFVDFFFLQRSFLFYSCLGSSQGLGEADGGHCNKSTPRHLLGCFGELREQGRFAFFPSFCLFDSLVEAASRAAHHVLRRWSMLGQQWDNVLPLSNQGDPHFLLS